MVSYNNLKSDSKDTKIPIWEQVIPVVKTPPIPTTNSIKTLYCLVGVLTMLIIGLSVSLVLLPFHYRTRNDTVLEAAPLLDIRGIFVNNSFSAQVNETSASVGTSVSFVRKVVNETDADLLVDGGIYWSAYVESLLPKGFTKAQAAEWTRYVGAKGTAVKLERGCGRMQNRLVTFADGRRACVRYRQNTDQIQGELFSFYLAQILNLRNLVPSAISLVDVSSKLWSQLSNEIASAQWSSHRPVVLTQYVPNLDASNIPQLLRPAERHLNKLDLNSRLFLAAQDDGDGEASAAGGGSNASRALVELAQWSDLIVFDYLTANLDRVVNNLYNYQWNSNIMEAPAHNLAKELDTELLVFLDNESGLLHGYRLLEKYEAYHGLLLDNLCLFRRATAQMIERLHRDANVGALLKEMFARANSARVRDVLPTIPDKSVKILNARIRRVHDQIVKCAQLFANT